MQVVEVVAYKPVKPLVQLIIIRRAGLAQAVERLICNQ